MHEEYRDQVLSTKHKGKMQNQHQQMSMINVFGEPAIHIEPNQNTKGIAVGALRQDINILTTMKREWNGEYGTMSRQRRFHLIQYKGDIVCIVSITGAAGDGYRGM